MIKKIRYIKKGYAMINIKINLADEKTEYGFMPYMETYILYGEKRPLIVIFPGGGYGMVSEREAERIATAYNAAGFHAAVVYYCVEPHRHPLPIYNAARALEILRERSDEWNIDKDKIVVCGFSAGGHLAASLCCLWNDPELFGNDTEKNSSHKPNAAVLSYPVITSGDHAHKDSFRNLIGTDDETNALYTKLSLEKQVNNAVPPTFLWHTYEDMCVPVENSLMYANKLRENGVPFEMHIFDKGEHGLSRVSDEVIWSERKFKRDYPWLAMSVDWINNLEF